MENNLDIENRKIEYRKKLEGILQSRSEVESQINVLKGEKLGIRKQMHDLDTLIQPLKAQLDDLKNSASILRQSIQRLTEEFWRAKDGY